MDRTISKEDLIELGFTKATSQKVIRQAKQVLVNRGYSFYSNKRLGRVPICIVEEILGMKF